MVAHRDVFLCILNRLLFHYHTWMLFSRVIATVILGVFLARVALAYSVLLLPFEFSRRSVRLSVRW